MHHLEWLELSNTRLTDVGVGKLIAIVEDGVPYGKVRARPRPSPHPQPLPALLTRPCCTPIHTNTRVPTPVCTHRGTPPRTRPNPRPPRNTTRCSRS